MDFRTRQDRHVRAVAIATLAGILPAVAVMLAPATLLAPLGDIARALVAFGIGALTMIVSTALLLRNDAASANPEANEVLGADSLVSASRNRTANLGLPRLKLPKMPWVKDEGDITELADLPKLRGGDVHPDAPARRPLWATSDLPVIELIEIEEEVLTEEPAATVAVEPAIIVEAASAPLPVAEPITGDAEPSLNEMVAQLEAAVTTRQQQLAELESVAAVLTAENRVQNIIGQDLSVADTPKVTEAAHHPVRIERLPLEAVSSPDQTEDVDAALVEALATLHRMNGTDR